jgi:hypothetical protein
VNLFRDDHISVDRLVDRTAQPDVSGAANGPSAMPNRDVALTLHIGLMLRAQCTPGAQCAVAPEADELPPVRGGAGREGRCAVVRVPCGRHGPAITAKLLGSLSDRDAGVRMAAVEAFARRNCRAVNDALLACLA